jgi:hypothetical protein
MHDGLAEVAVHGDFNGVHDFRKASEKASASEPGEPVLAVFPRYRGMLQPSASLSK